MQQTKITIVCENTVDFGLPLIGEHGFSCFIEHAQKSYLFDTGCGYGILHNSFALEKDLKKIDSIIFSHVHDDHTGGIRKVLEYINRKNVDIYTHENIFLKKYYLCSDDSETFVGFPFTVELLEDHGARFIFNRDFLKIGEDIYVTGEVPCINNFEKEKRLIEINREGERIQPDPCLDDNSLVIDTEKGLVILLGCGHAGIINIVDYVFSKLNKEIYAVIGGTHLITADDYRFAKTVEMFQKYDVKKIGVSHCTGPERTNQLMTIFKDRFFNANAGIEFII